MQNLSEKMEMSLDDIIKQNKTSKKTSSRGGFANRAREGRGSHGSGRRGAGVMRGRHRGGITRRFAASRNTSAPKREAFRISNVAGIKLGDGESEPIKLIVSNLDFGVTDSDILQLFEEFGPLKSASVRYNRSGRSLGTADIVFERKVDAIKAMNEYKDVPLDGREMKIQLVTSEVPRNDSFHTGSYGSRFDGGRLHRGTMNHRNKVYTASRGPRGNGYASRPRESSAKTGRGSSGKRGGGKSGGNRAPKKPITAEELDAQMDEYVKSNTSVSKTSVASCAKTEESSA